MMVAARKQADTDTGSGTAAFMARHGLAGVVPERLRGDASARRYYRLPGTGLLLMEDPVDPQGFLSYIRVARHLNDLGLSAPRVQGADPALGLALIEDWGEATYARRLVDGRSEEDLYALAIDALAYLHNAPRGTEIAQPRYDLATHLVELAVFCDWFAPAITPRLDIAGFRQRFLALWEGELRDVADRRDTLVLRDFHIDNLMELEGRDGVRRCGLLDFQDAVIGACEYDLVSLLQDARRDLSPGLEARMLDRYFTAAPAHTGDREAILARYHLLGAQRHARIAGVFVRLCRRDGKPGYLKWLPRVLGQLEAALRAAGLGTITEFLSAELPDWRRRGEALAQALSREFANKSKEQ